VITKRERHIVEGFNSLIFISICLLLSGCGIDQPDQLVDINIKSPENGTFYMQDEPVSISVEIQAPSGYEYMEVYLDQVLITDTDQKTFDTLLMTTNNGTNSHQLNVKAFFRDHSPAEAKSTYSVINRMEEAEDLESFSSAASMAWFLSGWFSDKGSGYEDEYALVSSGELSVALTRKRFLEPGSVCFHVKNGMETLEFYVDGQLKSSWFGREDWSVYIYAVDTGIHVFKWIAREDNVILDEVSFHPGFVKHDLGEHFGGGVIFYVDPNAEHGLIAAHEDGKYDGKKEIPWGCNGLQIRSGTRAASYSDGKGNTLAIIKDCNWEMTAARYCHDLLVRENSKVYDDWYLPALDELDLLHAQSQVVGNLDGEYYWSSTSISTNGARVINFYDGKHHGANRNIPMVTGPVSVGIYVRPIRKFYY